MAEIKDYFYSMRNLNIKIDFFRIAPDLKQQNCRMEYSRAKKKDVLQFQGTMWIYLINIIFSGHKIYRCVCVH